MWNSGLFSTVVLIKIKKFYMGFSPDKKKFPTAKYGKSIVKS